MVAVKVEAAATAVVVTAVVVTVAGAMAEVKAAEAMVAAGATAGAKGAEATVAGVVMAAVKVVGAVGVTVGVGATVEEVETAGVETAVEPALFSIAGRSIPSARRDPSSNTIYRRCHCPGSDSSCGHPRRTRSRACTCRCWDAVNSRSTPDTFSR